MTGAAPPENAGAALRIDKWLWFARFLKTRSLAARAVARSGVRINGARVTKPSAQVRPGDVLTFALGDHVRVIEILALGVRRGPAPEARALYDDLAPPAPRPSRVRGAADGPAPVGLRDPGAGRPTKRDRRLTQKLRDAGDH